MFKGSRMMVVYLRLAGAAEGEWVEGEWVEDAKKIF
jgi:hypothetical protein